jgi:hypothetical protein
MENDTIKSIVDLLQGGGSAVTLLAVWIAFQAKQVARDAVTNLREIRDAMVGTAQAPGLLTLTKQIAEHASETDERTKEMRRAADILELRVVTALSHLPQRPPVVG